MPTDVAANPTHAAVMAEGVAAWNAWRAANPGIQPQLVGLDLSDEDLHGVNLEGADLTGADFLEADLRSANLKMATLVRADLSGANLTGAELYKADLSGAYLTAADLSDTYLAEAVLTGAQLLAARLSGADLTGADLSEANLAEADLTSTILVRADISRASLRGADVTAADVAGLEHGTFHSMRGHYYGIRGLAACTGNALFVRDAQDQDYLDALELQIDATPSRWRRQAKRLLFQAWSRIDYGRSLLKPALYAMVLASLYGVIYWLDLKLGWGLMDYTSSAQSPLTPFYYSVVTYTTLGFGDITPKHWLGEIIVVSEVIFGYVSLGLLLSILANTVARRS